ncbi:sushi domain-containing 2 [Pelobates cultripes]|uniref:Sushi domain-containing 2 n=1 Tax=Pelobates cultripes TaxID=61616 RepID=A0AAD1WB76_PELCU|nr:sushi domain-containing 2 [Pelobates cultripes]
MPLTYSLAMCLLTLLSVNHMVSGAPESCNLQCGEKLLSCSCHASCVNLANCCADYKTVCLDISPYSGTLMGGKDFTINNLTFDLNANITCRFNNETITLGYVDNTNHAHCISPLLYETGRIPFTLSVNGDNSVLPSGTWLAVHHSKVSETEKSVLQDSKKWQYYGTPGYDGILTLTWVPLLLRAENIRIEVWGYNETGIPYSESWQASWTYLYTLNSSSPNSGSFSFLPSPAESPFDQWEVGLLRIVSTELPEGERDVQSLWSPVHALAWHLEESFRRDPEAWAYGKCIHWRDEETNRLPNFLKDVPDCPCTLAQSRADTGRYHTDYGCNIEKNSVCTYHPGAVHCVRSIQASPMYASGQQCCYDSNGTQILTSDSLGGSTPDRGHDWGSPPYRKPPRIPSFSHWLYDVITFYYCCLWSDNCQYYLELRPSSDCRTYKPPKVASAFGDPHLITFDGANFTFNGRGEYVLVNSPRQSLTIQGRTKACQHSEAIDVSASFRRHSRALRQAAHEINVTSFSSVVMQEGSSDVVEVRLLEESLEALETLLNGEVISFAEQSWLDLKGVFVYSATNQNVTVMFPSGAGLEVRRRGGSLLISVLLPEVFLNQTEGLLGVMNNDPTDDFTFPNGTILSPDATHEELFQFGAEWAVTNESSLFTYDSQELINDYLVKHDPFFLPIFTVEDPDDPRLEEMHMLCGLDPFCRFDYLVTDSLEVGNETKISHLSHISLIESLQPVVSCGWLAPPANGTKTGNTYLEGSVIIFHCNNGFILIGSRQRTCLPNGSWSGDTAQCILGETNSCASQCGLKLPECSCEVTCEKLGTCCLDYRSFCIRISPESGLVMGGRDFVILNVTFNNTANVTCRFNSDITREGYIEESGHAHCVSPLLYETGRIPFEMSVDGGRSYPYSGTWLSVHPGKVTEEEKCALVNDTKWQYYGTSNTYGTLTVTWDPSAFKGSSVNIEVWGYEELGEQYSSSWSAAWKYLYSLEKQYANNGSFTFTPKPADAKYNIFEFGSLRITPSQYQDGQMDVQSLWSVDHAMAWHLGEDFRKNSAEWATTKCLNWHKSDTELPNFLLEILDCPCTLAQARADSGRFHPDYGCDIDAGSVCTYHPGAVHCVRAIYGSPLYAAGQQCCYDSNGFQVLTSDSLGGSTPDRAHDWGSPPYKKPPRVPGFSHWLYDVITFYYCCLWSDNCQRYLELRPSSDCRTYKPPRVASAFGDPHFITFDNVSFTFKGRGEYVLVTSPYMSLDIQGRTQPAKFLNGSYSSVTGFSSIAMKENNSDVIEIRLVEPSHNLEILLNKEVIRFDRSWIDLKGVFLYSSINQNITVMFPSGAGVEIRGRGSVLSVTVLLPEEFMNQTHGLLGVMNNDPKDDFTFRNGTTLSLEASPEELFQLGADWSVTDNTSLFTYDSIFLIETYSTHHDPDFIPTFFVQEAPNDPIKEQMDKVCDSNEFCRFDVLTTRDLEVGNATKLSHLDYMILTESLQPVVSCGWLKPPTNGKKEGTSYLANSEVSFTCNKGYMLVGPTKRTCQMDGAWSGKESQCVPDNVLGIVLGCVFGLFALLILIVLIALNEKKRSKKREINVPPVTYQASNEP